VSKKELAIKIPEALAKGALLQGATSEMLELPKYHVFQDTSKERESYGKTWEGGDIIDTLECRILSNKFIPLQGFVTYMNWPDGASAPFYVLRDKSKVPVEDLIWGDNGTPPAATEVFNYLCMVEDEPMPYMLILKKSGFKAGKKLNTMETRRGMAGKGPGLYELGSTKTSGDNVYYPPTVKMIGDPSQQQLDQAARILEQIDVSNVAYAEDANISDQGEDGIPF